MKTSRRVNEESRFQFQQARQAVVADLPVREADPCAGLALAEPVLPAGGESELLRGDEPDPFLADPLPEHPVHPARRHVAG